MAMRSTSIVLISSVLGLLVDCVDGRYGNVSSNLYPGAENNQRTSQKTDKILASNHYISEIYINPRTLQKLLDFVLAEAPHHTFSVLYDSNFQDVDEILHLHHPAAIEVEVWSAALTSWSAILSPDLSTTRRFVLLLCSFEKIIQGLTMITSRSMESRTVWWILMITTQEEEDHLKGVLREGSRVVLLRTFDGNSFMILKSKMTNAGNYGFEEVGNWRTTPNSHRGSMKEELFQDTDASYTDLEGRQLAVTAANQKPFIMMEKFGDKLRAVSGFEYMILDSISQSLNFTYEMMMPPDGKWGGPLPDGSIIGMIGVVARREANFAMCEITITGLRETVIDFTYPYYIDSLALISRAPREKNRIFAVFSPFTAMVWLCIAMAVPLVGLFLAMDNMVLNFQWSLPLQEAVFNTFRSLLKQDDLIVSKHLSHQVTVLFWYLFCLIISALYSGMLIAALIKPSFEKTLNSLTDLPEAIRDGFTLIMVADTSIEHLFKHAKDGIYADIWKLFDPEDVSRRFISRAIESHQGILNEKLILISAELSSKFDSMDLGMHRFHFGRNTFSPQYFGVVCPTGSPFLPVLNKMYSFMIEGGLIDKWVDDELQKSASMNVLAGSSGPRPFAIRHLQAAFYILIIGFLAGIGSLIAEHIYIYL